MSLIASQHRLEFGKDPANTAITGGFFMPVRCIFAAKGQAWATYTAPGFAVPLIKADAKIFRNIAQKEPM
jgi:hypothetical protein